VKIVFVAFDCKKDNSVMYKKITIADCLFEVSLKSPTDELLGRELRKAIEKGADFCSVRFVK